MGIEIPVNTNYTHGLMVTKKLWCGQPLIEKV
jgi:hypothetical protein